MSIAWQRYRCACAGMFLMKASRWPLVPCRKMTSSPAPAWSERVGTPPASIVATLQSMPRSSVQMLILATLDRREGCRKDFVRGQYVRNAGRRSELERVLLPSGLHRAVRPDLHDEIPVHQTGNPVVALIEVFLQIVDRPAFVPLHVHDGFRCCREPAAQYVGPFLDQVGRSCNALGNRRAKRSLEIDDRTQVAVDQAFVTKERPQDRSVDLFRFFFNIAAATERNGRNG